MYKTIGLNHSKFPHIRMFPEIPFYQQRRIHVGDSINGIPLTLYQSWHSRQVPEALYKAHQQLVDKNPELDMYFYTDQDCLRFIREEFEPEVGDAFEALNPGAYKCDLWRYCILYKRGGIYLDAKFEALVPLGALLLSEPHMLVKDYGYGSWNEWVYNGVIASPPGNPIFRYCIDDIVESYRGRLYRNGSLDITGPELLGRVCLLTKGKPFVESQPFQFLKFREATGEIGHGVLYRGALVLRFSEESANQQKQSQRTEHYNEAFENKRVWKN